ncbi:hypothetical protein J2810_003691 [Chryseobacterium rhizosphaerae]|uniref:hypothetical protein n=1 Tax=Chryseobacterium rhizosphaerae TaxID=395937 RepID=UPI000645B33A|nr:hypothetical protein [Chryseobacterium rhizosphaerae]MDR6547606.1 hypothetical protein [Chryseobacterium rhizosphaerae]
MKKLKFYRLRLNKKYVFFFGILFFILSCNQEKPNKNQISASVIKKQKLDRNSLLLTLLFKNDSEKNYALSIFPEYYLVKSKGGIIYYGNIDGGGLMNITGKIVSSDFADQMEDWEKGSKLLNTFYKKTRYNYKEADKHLFSFAMHDYQAYASYILFLPKKSERKMIICFNSYKVNNETFYDKNTRVAADWEFFAPRAKILDSLLKKEKIDYTVYDRNIVLKDSLFINKIN